ncbi:MAG: CoA transferase [Dysosmobacter sp.]
MYETKDGYISISLSKHADMVSVLEPGCLDAFTEQDAIDRRDEYDAVVAEQLKKKTTDDWCRIFTQAGIWHVKPYTYQDIEQDPQIQWNKSILTIHHPIAGDVRVLNHPINTMGIPPTADSASKQGRQHTGNPLAAGLYPAGYPTALRSGNRNLGFLSAAGFSLLHLFYHILRSCTFDSTTFFALSSSPAAGRV